MIRPLARLPEPPASRRSRFPSALLAMLLWFSVLGLAATASAQHPDTTGTVPPPPPGNGVLNVQIRPDAGAGVDTDAIQGLSVALYALGPDGNPGFASGETDAQGLAVFRGISANPDIVYLVGAEFAGIPFGQRVAFTPGEASASVEIEVSRPTDRVAGVEIEELRMRLDWMGDRVVVQEILRFKNPGERVVLVPEQDSGRAIALRVLPESASDFATGATSIGEGLELVDGRVRFSGPLYPGEQRVEYQYSLPLAAPGGTVPIELREAVNRVVVVAGTIGLEVAGRELIASSEVTSDSGQPLAAWARAGLAAGQRFEVAIELPETRHDAELVSIPRGDVWLELDDARLTATVDLRLQVAPGAPVSGTPEAPLFHVLLPTGATLNGVAPEAEALGLIPTANGGFDVIGPIGPGETRLGYSYQMPVDRGGVELDLRVPRDVGTLNVLIADTELELDSSRLHRRRPFRSGTRNYLHREAYRVTADEVVDLRIVPIRGGELPRWASGALALGALLGGVYFLVIPLLSKSRAQPAPVADWEPIRAEREAVYVSIRDLDHDFETGKLENDDYQSMREGLRERAIELLRLEREGRTDSASATGPTPEPAEISQRPPATIEGSPAGPPTLRTATYCPHCGGAAKPDWRFCTHCGGQLDPGQEVAG